jgi:hypothetical protein
MASDPVDIGTALTIGFGTSTTFTPQILDVTPPEMSRGSVNTSHMATTTLATYIPLAIVEGGELEFEFHFNPDTDPPIDAAPETITITYGSTATWAFTGFLTNYRPGAPFEDKMTGTCICKVSGDITISPAS